MRFCLSALTTALALFVVALSPQTARAHSMSATVEVRPEAVRVVVYFEDDLPAELATVTVTNAAGAEVASGTTDDRGVCSFPPLPPGEYKLGAKCTGHTATVAFVVAGPTAPPAPTEFEGPRANKAFGLVLGTGGLLGASALFWFFRRRS